MYTMDKLRGPIATNHQAPEPSGNQNEIHRPENSPSPTLATEQEVNKPLVEDGADPSSFCEAETSDDLVRNECCEDDPNSNRELQVPDPSNENSQPNGASPRKVNRNVSFPTDSTIVMGYLEPQDPWKSVPNWRTEDLIRAYKKSCERHGTKPLNKLLQQLQCIENVGERYEILSLKGERLDMKQCESIEEILRHVRFRCIDLEATHLDDEMAVSLFEMVEFYESACKLNISFNKNIGARAWQSCSRLVRKTPCLTFVDARNCDLNDRVIPILGRALRMGCYLTRLQLQNTNLAGRALVILVAALKMNETLKELFIGDNKFLPTDGVHIGNLLKFNHKLELLDLRNNHLQDVGMNHICDGLKEHILDSGLLTLVMWNNQISFQGMGPINKALSVCEHLETLNLGHNPITNEGIHILKDGLLKSRSLIKLGLSGTKVTCEGAVALAEVIADSPRLVRLDLQENDIKTAGLMALSLALKVNESLTRLDLDRDTKKESGMKDYAEQQKRLQQDVVSLLERNRDLTHKREEERRQIELKNLENARKLQEAAQDIEVMEKEEEMHAYYIPSEDKIHRPKLLFLPTMAPEHELDSPAIDSEMIEPDASSMQHLQLSGTVSDLLSPQYCLDPKGTAKKLFSVTKVTSPTSTTSSKSSGSLKSFPNICSPSDDISSPLNILDSTTGLEIPQLCVPLPSTAIPTHSTNSSLGFTASSMQDIVSPGNLQKVIEEQTLVTYIQQIVGDSSSNSPRVVEGETPRVSGEGDVSSNDTGESDQMSDSSDKGKDGGESANVEEKAGKDQKSVQSSDKVDGAEVVKEGQPSDGDDKVVDNVQNSTVSDCDRVQQGNSANASADNDKTTINKTDDETSVTDSDANLNCNNFSNAMGDSSKDMLKTENGDVAGVNAHCDRDNIPESDRHAESAGVEQVLQKDIGGLEETEGNVEDDPDVLDVDLCSNPHEQNKGDDAISSQGPNSSFANCDVSDLIKASVSELTDDKANKSKAMYGDDETKDEFEKWLESNMNASSVSENHENTNSVIEPAFEATKGDIISEKGSMEDKSMPEATEFKDSAQSASNEVSKDNRVDSGDLEPWNTVSQSDIADLETPVLVPKLSEGLVTNLSMNGLRQELASVIDDEERNQLQQGLANEAIVSSQQSGTGESMIPNGTKAPTDWFDTSETES